MRSVVHDRFGEPADVLFPAVSPLPQPGRGEVRIKTILSPIHNHDLWTIRGTYGYKPQLPAIGGTEAVGLVDALGEGVDGVTIGQRITVATAHGTWAEYFVVPAAQMVPVPDAITDEAAAQLLAMPLSAAMLLDFLNVGAGDWIVQNTANGAVGKILSMLAKARDVHALNLVRRDEGVAELAALGIDNVVSTARDGWQDEARRLLGPGLARAAVDSIGGDASAALLSLLGEGGTLVSFGTMGGGPMHVPSGDLIFKQAVVKGFWGAKVAAALSGDDKRRLIGELMRLVISGALQLPVESIHGFDDAAGAARASLRPGRKGKVLFRP